MMEQVLVIDDSPTMIKILKDMLTTANYQVITASTGLEAISILRGKNSPDLVILNRVMPHINGDDVCQWVRANIRSTSDNYCYKYLILLTALESDDQILEGFELGADDYITKPFNTSELLARLSVGKRILKLQRELWLSSIKDSLTGLYNRRVINELLILKTKRAIREHKQLIIAFLDIDCFKNINDRYGHEVGDQAIIAVANRMRNALRDCDLTGRWGGDEFVYAFDCDNTKNLLEVCERVRQMITTEPVKCGKISISLAISIGVAIISDNTSPLQAINWADKALYESKHKGKNQITLYNAEHINLC